MTTAQISVSNARTPDLSVVLVTHGRFESIRKTVEHLTAQTAREQMELVIMAPAATAASLERAAKTAFPASRVVPSNAAWSAPESRAAGIRAALAPVVVFAEDHSFPDANWAAALIQAHQGPWTVVGPVIDNANPGGFTSWANLFLNYGSWVAPSSRPATREVHHLPGHNSSYKRAALLGYEDRLGAMLEAESFLHWELHSQGHRLCLEPRARTFHLNITLPSAFVLEHLYVGRVFGGLRAQQWPLPRRMLAILTTPLIPFRRVLTVLGDIRIAGRQRQLLPGILPAVFVGLICRAVGELIGHILGPGASMERLSEYEVDRMRYLSKADRVSESLI